jgi:iron complex outermembrane recepter protein
MLMMKTLITLLTIILLHILSFKGIAQTGTGKVSGQVKDVDQKVLQAATVSLLKAKDSTLVKMFVCDKEGKFQLDNLAAGKYLLRVSSVGHEKIYSGQFEIPSATGSVELGVLSLKPLSKNLKEVTVTSGRPPVEQKIDRMIVNVEASVTNVGSSALEVLEKSPGISVDKDGNISLKGKDGVIVLIDGRQTYLGGEDLANLLRSMHANQLDQIEIMTNPPAKYDAAGNSGIINIKTKKNKLFGYNGSVTLGYGQGKYPKANDAFNFNYRKNKVNLFTNLSHNYNRNYNELSIQRNFLDKHTKDPRSHFDQKARTNNQANSFNGKIGIDYFADKKTTFGLVLNGFLTDRTNNNSNRTEMSKPSGTLDSITRATNNVSQQWKNFSANGNFRRLLDTLGQELTADVDYMTYTSKNNPALINSYFDAFDNPTNTPDTLLGNLPQDIKIYSAKADYLKPLKKGARFEAGIKSSYVRTDNNAIYDSILNGNMVHDTRRSNHFIYEENINAAYANISGPLNKKWNGQLGLRLENTHAKGNQITQNIPFDRNYTQLFPTAYLQYVPNKKNSFVLNYGRRIRRPDYQNLNPFINFIDKYTYQQGNPNLRPQFSHNIELSHTYRNFLTTTLNYTRTTDIIQNVIEQNEETNETYIKKSNIAKQRQYGISVNANNPITKWWQNSFYVNVFNNKFDGIVNDTLISISATTLTLNGSQQFKFAKTWTAEVSGFFRTAGLEGVIRSKPFGQVSIGFGKQIMKNNGSIRLGIRDVFYTQRFRGVSKYSNVDAQFQERGDSRVVNIAFTYRFTKGKLNGTPRRRANSASEEQNRVGAGN